MRIFVSLIAAALMAGCSPMGYLHETMHPSLRGDSNGAGISAGLLYGTEAETDSTSKGHIVGLPYGEGWARFAAGDGQVELRVTPALGFAGYRWNLVSAADGPIGLAVKPSLGFGLYNAGDSNSSSTEVMLAPNLAVMLFFAGGRGYVAPRAGYLRMMEFGDNAGDSMGLISLGGSAGFIVDSDPFDFSLELSFQRITSTDENDDGAIYLIAPTIGIQI